MTSPRSSLRAAGLLAWTAALLIATTACEADCGDVVSDLCEATCACGTNPCVLTYDGVGQAYADEPSCREELTQPSCSVEQARIDECRRALAKARCFGPSFAVPIECDFLAPLTP